MSSRLSRTLLALIVTIVSIGSGQVVAQTAAERPAEAGVAASSQEPQAQASSRSDPKDLLREIASDFRHFPSLGSALWVGGGGALSLIARPNEKTLNVRFVGPEWVDAMYDGGRFAGDGYTQVGAAFLTYLIGTWTDKPKVQHIGSDLIRSHALAGVPTVILKQTVRRERPDHGRLSFPSGHASITFASATILQRHLGWRAGVPAYLAASWVAASRLHENQHYASDVLFGAAIGIAAGRTVTRHGRSNWVLVPAAPAGGGGIGIALTRIPAGSDGSIGKP